MAHVWFFCGCFLAGLVPAYQYCSTSTPLSAVERYLYVQLEDALVNDAATLEQLREVFFQEPPGPNIIQFNINITADSIPANNCSVSSPQDTEPAFCPVNETTSYSKYSTTKWKLCSFICVTLEVPYEVDAVDLIQALALKVIPWCAHGLSLAVILTNNFGSSNSRTILGGCTSTWYHEPVPVKVNLKLTELNCQPYTCQLNSAVRELLSWVSTNHNISVQYLSRVHACFFMYTFACLQFSYSYCCS